MDTSNQTAPPTEQPAQPTLPQRPQPPLPPQRPEPPQRPVPPQPPQRPQAPLPPIPQQALPPRKPRPAAPVLRKTVPPRPQGLPAPAMPCTSVFLTLPAYKWGPFVALKSIILRAFTFKGRASRSEYWFSVLASLIITGILELGTAIITFCVPACEWMPNIVYILLILALHIALWIPFLAVTVRRLHDIGVSGKWLLWFVLCIIAPILLGIILSYCGVKSSGSFLVLFLLSIPFYIYLDIKFIGYMCKRSSAMPKAMSYGDAPLPPADIKAEGNFFTRCIAHLFGLPATLLVTGCAVGFCYYVGYQFNQKEWGICHEIGYYTLITTNAAEADDEDFNFLSKQVNNNKFDKRYPLHSAIRKGHYKGVQILLKAETASVNACDESNNTPLHIAAQEGNVAIVKLLLDTPGIRPHERNRSGETPADVATDECKALIIEAAGEPPSRSNSYYNYYWGY